MMKFEFVTEEQPDMQMHQNIKIFYVLKGSVQLIIDQQQYNMMKGDLILVNANKKHKMMKRESDILLAGFEIDYSKMTEHLGTNQILFWCNSVTDKKKSYELLRNKIEQILAMYFDESAGAKFHRKSLYYEIIYLLVQNFMVKVGDEKFRLLFSKEDARIFEIRSYLHANYHKQVTLKELAEQMHFSQAYLSRYIKQNFGMSFMEYLNNIRLFHAVDDLLYTDKRMIEIAINNGYPTSASFNKAFKNFYHMTPTEYRKNMQQNRCLVNKSMTVSYEQEEKLREYLQEENLYDKEQDKVHKSVKLSVDCNSFRELKRPWNELINMGEAYMLLRSEVQEHMRILCSELKFRYGRIWNMFSICIYDEKEVDDARINFSRLDRVFDFMAELSIKPHIELAPKPQIFIATAEKIIYSKATEFKFGSFEEYIKFLRRIMIHLINRYSLEEVETWRFELWKEQRMNIQWETGQYFQNFKLIRQMLKSFSEKIQVGGPGIILGYENYLYQPLFENWEKCGVRPDFLSVYSYGYVAYKEKKQLHYQKSQDEKYTLHQLELMKRIAEENIGTSVDLIVSEWNYTISNRNILNDGCNMGAYVIKNCIDMESYITNLAYSQATDLFSEYYDTEQELNGDLGLLTKSGIKKPSFYALYFLQELYDYVIGKNEYMIVTSNRKNSFVIVCCNMKKLNRQSSMKAENEIKIGEKGLYEDTESLLLNVEIEDIKNGAYIVENSFVNQSAGSVQDQFIEMGLPRELSEKEIAYLKMISAPHIRIEQLNVNNEKLKLKVKLEPYEIRMIKIDYQYFESNE